MDVKKLDKKTLLELSKVIKKYRSLKKNVGKKSSQIIHHELKGSKKIVVEYFGALDIKDIKDTAINIYSDIFGIKVEESNIDFIKNDNLCGGTRIFYGDDMIDISFENVKNILKK